MWVRPEDELVELIGVFEVVDRHIDTINDIDGELGASLASLRRLTARAGAVPADVVDSVARFFARSETLRTTTDARALVRYLVPPSA